MMAISENKGTPLGPAGWPPALMVIATAAAIGIIIVAVGVTFNWELLVSTNAIPFGDYAADDLLVQDAKHFTLMHGHYSRIGFNHPGPFYLQMIALVELLFHDWTGAIQTPIATHVLAAILLQAAAQICLFLAMRRLTSSITQSLVGLAVSIAATRAMIDTGQIFLTGLWMPLLNISASTLVAAGCIGIAAGSIAWSSAVVLGLCCLVHGHASFIGLSIIMGLCVLAWVHLKDGIPTPTFMEYRKWLLSHRATVLLNAAIIGLFVAPIVVHTVLSWPGEIPSYLRFAAEPHVWPLREVITYLEPFFPCFGIWMLIFIIPDRRLGESIECRKAALLLLMVSIPAAVVFVARGLDTLQYRYPLYWVGSFTGPVVGLAVLRLARLSESRIGSPMILLGAFCLSVWSIPLSSWKANGVAQDGGPFRAALSAMLQDVDMGQHVSLTADLASYLSVVDVSALLVLDKHQSNPKLCVDDASWHIAYTRAYKCSLVRQSIVKSFYITSNPGAGSTPLVRLPEVGIYEIKH
jgi:hypothetical protein